jgi:exodeoxyribonuclease VII large subunit
MVEGEVSRVTYHGSGHLYFTLKDKNSSISCVMFKGNNQRLKFRVEEGMAVILGGGISLYTPRGSYQINCSTLEPAGSGALALAYEQLKNRLESKGYFSQDIKKELPKFPKHIVLVTSQTGAALQDMLNVANKRWAMVKITIIDTIVQGDSAAPLIAQNIVKADALDADIIIVGRGGGSLEDLWAFNEEIVADAIYRAKTPIISAVGHEIDFLISDFTADLRAPTPSAAMELALPDINEIRMFLDSVLNTYNATMIKLLENKTRDLSHQKELLKQNSHESKILFYQDEIKSILQRYKTLSKQLLNQKHNTLKHLLLSYEINNPSKKDKIGFAQLSIKGKLVALEDLKKDDIFVAQSSKVTVKAKVQSIKEHR